jgi:hypothetical protein
MSLSSLLNQRLILRQERSVKPQFCVKKRMLFVQMRQGPLDIKKRFPTGVSVGNGLYFHKELFSESEFFDQLAVTSEVGFAQIGKKTFSFTYQLHQATMSGEIFFIGLQVFRDPVDPLCHQCDLALDRACVGGFSTKFCKEARFFLFCQIRHLKLIFGCGSK